MNTGLQSTKGLPYHHILRSFFFPLSLHMYIRKQPAMKGQNNSQYKEKQMQKGPKQMPKRMKDAGHDSRPLANNYSKLTPWLLILARASASETAMASIICSSKLSGTKCPGGMLTPSESGPVIAPVSTL